MSRKKQRKIKKKKVDTKSKKKPKESKEDKARRLEIENQYKSRLREQTEDFKQDKWQKHFSRIAAVLQNEKELQVESDDLMPFDFVATNDQEFDAQKDTVIEKIHHLLAIDKPDDSIALFREARCLWPNDPDTFGKATSQGDEEFDTLKTLYFKQIEIKKPLEDKRPEETEDEQLEDNSESKPVDEDIYGEDENNELIDDDDNNQYLIEEENLDFEKFVFRYTNPSILKCFILMLGEYAKNSDFLNRCCMIMFERIAYDCHAFQCLYQLSLFYLVNRMYKDPMSRSIMNIMQLSSSSGSYCTQRSIDCLYASTYSSEDMFAFFRQLVAKFVEQSRKNEKIFLELLLFKDKKMIYCLGEEGEGYAALGQNVGVGKKVAWTQEERDELKELFERFKIKFEKMRNEDEERVQGDLIDQIMLHIKDGARKRREICVQLVNLGCVKSVDELELDAFKAGNSTLGRSKIWRDDDVQELKECFELMKAEAEQTNKPLGEIIERIKNNLKVSIYLRNFDSHYLFKRTNKIGNQILN